MLRRLFFIFSLLLSIPLITFAQLTYGYKYNTNTLEGSIYRLTAENEFQFIVTLDSNCPIFGDIAIDPAGDIYGVTQDGFIHFIDLDLATSSEVGNFIISIGHTSFAIDNNSICYSLNAEGGLYSYDLTTGEESLVSFVAEFTPGDLCFYNGKLAYISPENKIKAIDLETGDITTIYCIPEEILESLEQAWGLANSFQNCGTEELWITNTNNELFLIDVEANTFEDLNPTYSTDAGGVFYGFASSNDSPASTCQGVVTEVNCEEIDQVAELESNFNEAPFYPNPVVDLIHLVDAESISLLSLTDMSGRIIRQISDPEENVYLGDLSKGVYLIEVLDKNGRIILERLVKE